MTPGNERSTSRAALASGTARLQGWRCRACGTTSFPIAEGCIVCGNLSGDAVDLAWSGTLESLTIVGTRIVCEVRLDDGPVVLGWLDLIAAQKSNVGARCALRQGSSSDRAGVHDITFLTLNNGPVAIGTRVALAPNDAGLRFIVHEG